MLGWPIVLDHRGLQAGERQRPVLFGLVELVDHGEDGHSRGIRPEAVGCVTSMTSRASSSRWAGLPRGICSSKAPSGWQIGNWTRLQSRMQ